MTSNTSRTTSVPENKKSIPTPAHHVTLVPHLPRPRPHRRPPRLHHGGRHRDRYRQGPVLHLPRALRDHAPRGHVHRPEDDPITGRNSAAVVARLTAGPAARGLPRV